MFSKMKVTLGFFICIFVIENNAVEDPVTMTVRRCSQSTVRHDVYFSQFKQFIVRYQKVYRNRFECVERYLLFKRSIRRAAIYQMLDEGSAVYGATFFSDLRKDELKKYHGLRMSHSKHWANTTVLRAKDIPEEWDWRQKNAVTPVGQQGSCGACYAFGLSAALESAYAIKHNKLFNLSQQQIVDCSPGNNGCDGGYFDKTADYAVNIGLMLGEDYPYVASEGKCKHKPEEVAVKALGYTFVSNNEENMAQYVYQKGPIAVAVDSNGPIGLYEGGIIDTICGYNLNHVVLIVGYGVGVSRKGVEKPYWIVKNSWGKYYGENGYFRIVRNKGMCGINQISLAFQV